jgi:hypothetical protein
VKETIDTMAQRRRKVVLNIQRADFAPVKMLGGILNIRASFYGTKQKPGRLNPGK